MRNRQGGVADSFTLQELAQYGKTNIRRAYGNWKSEYLKNWEACLHEYAITPIQQFDLTKGKNATDMAITIDAMDLLYSGNVEAFALMTSDSDFTPLVLRMLEAGLPVYGFGEKKTPQAFVDACSTFIYTENLGSDKDEDEQSPVPAERARKSRNELRGNTSLVRLLRTAVEQASDDDGWAHLGRVGQYISNNSSFSPINYGYRKIGDLIRASELFAIEMRKDGTAMYIRDARLKAG